MLGMSKLRLIGLLAGVIAAFSVVGFAASVTLAPERVINAEGEVLVESCDNEILVWKLDRWLDPTNGGGPGSGGFYAWMIQLRSVNATCIGNNFNIVVTGAQGEAIATSGWFLYTGSPANINWTVPTPIPVSQIHDIHVAISSNPQ